MMIPVQLSKTMLHEEQKAAVQLFCESLASMPDHQVKSIFLYGSAARTDYRPGVSDINLLIILERADILAMTKFIEPVAKGRISKIAPLFLTIPELIKLSSAFPLKYLSIMESHLILYGEDNLAEIRIGRESLEIRCRQEMLNLLMRLRRHYLYSMGHNLTRFLVSSLKGFLEVLRIFLYLKNDCSPSREEIFDAAESILGEDAFVIREISQIKISQDE
ncbi:MAG: nucleotidyltransferase domain-containing protein, partial [Smithella sp.]